MSKRAWFAEFERSEALRQDRLDRIKEHQKEFVLKMIDEHILRGVLCLCMDGSVPEDPGECLGADTQIEAMRDFSDPVLEALLERLKL